MAITIHNWRKIKLNPATAPRLVATPLPPLNLRKIVQLCPQTAITAAKIIVRLLAPNNI